MVSYNRKTIRAMNKLARTKRIKSNRVRSQLVQRLLGIGPLEASERLLTWPLVEHPSRVERRDRERAAAQREALRGAL